MPKRRVSVYIDGFNLYHAVDALSEDHLKWLDLRKLSKTLVRSGEVVTCVKYFSAYATWREDSYRRHQTYVAALKACGVQFIEGKFKRKRVQCRLCQGTYFTHEEKETDVNIGAHLMADALKGRFDRALVVSADTDLNAAVRHTRDETTGQNLKIDIVAPPGRMNLNSEALFEATVGRIRSSLLPERVISNGREIHRPPAYDPQ